MKLSEGFNGLAMLVQPYAGATVYAKIFQSILFVAVMLAGPQPFAGH